MRLADWLKTRKQRGMTQDAFARRIGVTQGRVSQIAIRGTSDLKIALAIREATDGEVSLTDLFPENSPKAAAEQATGDAA